MNNYDDKWERVKDRSWDALFFIVESPIWEKIQLGCGFIYFILPLIFGLFYLLYLAYLKSPYYILCIIVGLIAIVVGYRFYKVSKRKRDEIKEKEKIENERIRLEQAALMREQEIKKNEILEEEKKKEDKLLEFWLYKINELERFVKYLPTFSYTTWVSWRENYARGRITGIYESLGYTVEYFEWDCVKVQNNLSGNSLLIKYNNNATKPSAAAMNKFLQQFIRSNCDKALFLTMKEPSENAITLAKENIIPICELPAFILYLFAILNLRSQELFKGLINYFNDGYKSNLIEVINKEFNNLEKQLNSLKNEISESRYKSLLSFISQVESKLEIISDDFRDVRNAEKIFKNPVFEEGKGFYGNWNILPEIGKTFKSYKISPVGSYYNKFNDYKHLFFP